MVGLGRRKTFTPDEIVISFYWRESRVIDLIVNNEGRAVGESDFLS